MSIAKFNTVAILDAIPTGELSTARQLEGELLDLKYQQAHLNVQYYRIDSLGSLSRTIAQLRECLRTHGLVPLLHIEGHGLSDKRGFAVASGVPCSWSMLKDLVTPLNIDLHLALVLK